MKGLYHLALLAVALATSCFSQPDVIFDATQVSTFDLEPLGNVINWNDTRVPTGNTLKSDPTAVWKPLRFPFSPNPVVFANNTVSTQQIGLTPPYYWNCVFGPYIGFVASQTNNTGPQSQFAVSVNDSLYLNVKVGGVLAYSGYLGVNRILLSVAYDTTWHAVVRINNLVVATVLTDPTWAFRELTAKYTLGGANGVPYGGVGFIFYNSITNNIPLPTVIDQWENTLLATY